MFKIVLYGSSDQACGTKWIFFAFINFHLHLCFVSFNVGLHIRILRETLNISCFKIWTLFTINSLKAITETVVMEESWGWNF